VFNFSINFKSITFCFLIGWLTVVISFIVDLYIANKVNWFPRSGAVLCMLSITAEFWLHKIDRNLLISNVNDALDNLRAIELGTLYETKYDERIKFFAHTSVAVGTFIWAYGDLVV